ncbi:MAG: 16S rRNA (uracil(1498)-N(3))-methyltransferase [Balneolales bacterium]|nr:16S rRNA (uracil(1498)-N(3))-methyltransferase [Balneolales bacterium]
MNLFYVSEFTTRDESVQLIAEEAHHALNVLRYKTGDLIHVFNGKGLQGTGTLEVLSKKSCLVHLDNTIFNEAAVPEIEVCLGLIKNRQRLEWAVEKLTETGVSRITLLHTERTERNKFRADRLESVILTAAKQSKCFYLPILRICTLNERVEEIKTQRNQTKQIYPLVAHENEAELTISKTSSYTSGNFSFVRDQLHQVMTKGFEIVIFIGPEGGFSEPEIKMMLSETKGDDAFSPLWLGKNRLRAETAAVQCAGLLRFGI